MENKITPVDSYTDGSFTGPVAGAHLIYIHIAASFVAMLAVEKEQKKVLALQAFDVNEASGTNESSSLSLLLTGLADQHPWLSNPALVSKVLVPGNGLALVPESVFDPYAKELMMEPQYQIQSSDIIVAEKLVSHPLIAVFALHWNYNQQLKSRFPLSQLNHEDTCWINAVLSAKDKGLSSSSAVLYLERNTLKVAGIFQGKLLFFNKFYVEGNNDVLYYLQLCLNQNKMDVSSTGIFLAGPESSNAGLDSFLNNYSFTVSPLILSSFNELPVELRKKYSCLYLPLFSLITCG
ncbi:MAG: DUF3822 family protein [Bacteroidales bacterium]